MTARSAEETTHSNHTTEQQPKKKQRISTDDSNHEGETASAAVSSLSSSSSFVPYSIGYATARPMSIHDLLLHCTTLPAPLCLGPSSTFLDIGSGIGQVVLHTQILVRPKLCIGIEIVKARHEVAVKLKRRLDAKLALQGSESQLFFGDIAQLDKHLLISQATHIYMFDYVFNEATSEVIFPLISTSPTDVPRVIITCKGPEHRLVKEANLCVLHSVCMSTSGNQSFTIYIYKTTRTTTTNPSPHSTTRARNL